MRFITVIVLVNAYLAAALPGRGGGHSSPPGNRPSTNNPGVGKPGSSKPGNKPGQGQPGHEIANPAGPSRPDSGDEIGDTDDDSSSAESDLISEDGFTQLQKDGREVRNILENVRANGPPPRKGPAPTQDDLSTRYATGWGQGPSPKIPHVWKVENKAEQSGPG